MKKLLSLLLAVCMLLSMVTVGAVSVGAAEAAGAAGADGDTKTITVGVISYLMNELKTGWQVHYWGGKDGAKDADLTATGATEKKSVGSEYWSGAEQTFTMFTVAVPADFTGYKVHNGDRWFGGDGTADKCTAYVFNYDGDKALYEVSSEPVTEAPTEEPSEAPTEVTEAPTEVTEAPTEVTEAPTEPHERPYSMKVFVGAVLDALDDANCAYAWTWGENNTGEWRPIEKFAYVSVSDNVLFAFFDTQDLPPAWGKQVAQTVDFVVEDTNELTLLNQKDEEGKYLGEWYRKPTEAPATEAPTEVTEPETEEPTKVTEAPTEPTQEPTDGRIQIRERRADCDLYRGQLCRRQDHRQRQLVHDQGMAGYRCDRGNPV